MAGFDTGQPTFSVQAVYVAKNNGGGAFGPLVQIYSAKTIAFDLKTISDQSQGDSKITATAAQLIAADFTLDVAGISFPALQVLTALTSASSADGTHFTMNNFRFNYFGLIAQAWAAENAGDTLYFLPRCKMMTGWTWRLEFGKIVTPQFKATAIQDPTLGYVMDLKERADSSLAIAFPPSW